MINTVLSSGTPASSATSSTVSLSDVVIESDGEGTVWLEQRVPSGNWTKILSGPCAEAVYTPDTSIEYRFNSRSLEDNVRVFFGP